MSGEEGPSPGQHHAQSLPDPPTELHNLQTAFWQLPCSASNLTTRFGAAGALYLDDGHSFAYKRGVYTERAFTYADNILSNAAAGIASALLPPLDVSVPIPAGAKGLKSNAVVERIIVLGLPGGPVGWRATVQGSSQALQAGPGPLRLKQGLPEAGLVIRKPGLAISAEWSIHLFKTSS